MLGTPRRHFHCTDSTNARLRELAIRGAPHGTLVTADEQTAGRGRQGRTWSAPPHQALLLSLLIREPNRLLSLAAGVAVAELCGQQAELKWPNDVLLGSRKVAGILVEGRPREHWAILGIGLNVAVEPNDLPPEIRTTAASLNLSPGHIEAVLQDLLKRLTQWTLAPDDQVLEAVRQRDALRGRPVSWTGGRGTAAGIDPQGRLIVETDGGRALLLSGEVHLLGKGVPYHPKSR
jgi:BirA family biotin operon repressor/biotin-[acetyl-CoA-carboxylase] ligase